MTDVLLSCYSWIKAFHVISVIAWMAGMFYLPRLFVYHVEGYQKRGVTRGSEMDQMFCHQERLLMKAIINPAMIATWLFGGLLVSIPGVVDWSSLWPWVKMAGVIGLTGFHGFLSKSRRNFSEGKNQLSGRQWRLLNEVPTILMIVIVIAVIVKF